MIREFEKEDLKKVAEIWLNSNITVHDFIKKIIGKIILKQYN